VDVAITGSSGLIGSRLAASLEADGHAVRRVTRGDPGPGRVTWAPEEGRLDAAGLEGVDAVVHLAGEGIANRRWTDEQKARLRESRTLGTALLATTLAALDPRPGVLLSGSAMGFYGDRGDEVLTESAPPASGFLARLCVDWEAATAPAAQAGIRVAHLRTSMVLDRDGGALAKMLPLFKLGLGGKMGSGKQWWSWVTLDDHVAATRYLLDHEVSGPVNLAAPGAVTNDGFTRALGAALHRPAVLPVPPFGPKLLLGGELAQELLFTSARLRPAVLEDAGFTFAQPTIDAAFRHVLGG
jgi:uncharacterized protein (TIGR01777 family)